MVVAFRLGYYRGRIRLLSSLGPGSIARAGATLVQLVIWSKNSVVRLRHDVDPLSSRSRVGRSVDSSEVS